MICRKCKENISVLDNYVRTTVRHTSHWNCFFGDSTIAEAQAKFAKLSQAQRNKCPWAIYDRLHLGDIPAAQPNTHE